jgi:hypothetical protein
LDKWKLAAFEGTNPHKLGSGSSDVVALELVGSSLDCSVRPLGPFYTSVTLFLYIAFER